VSSPLEKTIHLFLGVDEYQVIPREPRVHDRSPLSQLLHKVQEVAIYPPQGLEIYPMFAGTEWFYLTASIRNCGVEARRVPLPLPSFSDFQSVLLQQQQFASLFDRPNFSRHMAYFGTLPRAVIKFALSVSRGVSVEEAFQSTWQECVVAIWTDVDDNSKIRLAAHSLAEIPVEPTHEAGVTVFQRDEHNHQVSTDTGLSWSALADMGLLLLEPLEGGKSVVRLPYCVLRLCGMIRETAELSKAQRCLVSVLAWFRKYVDAGGEHVQDWENWERFGAAYHALRVNSFLVLEQNPIALTWLLPNFTGSDRVWLRPMCVVQADQPFQDMDDQVWCRHTRDTWCWVQDSEGISWVVQNGVSGAGVDVVFSLQLVTTPTTESWILIGDQRKCEALQSFATAPITSYAAKARVACGNRATLGSKTVVKTILAIFSLLATQSTKATVPKDTLVFSYPDFDSYHGTLSGHPATCTAVDINYANISTLRLIFSHDIAQKLMHGRFWTPETFEQFLQTEKFTLSGKDRLRVVYGSDDE